MNESEQQWNSWSLNASGLEYYKQYSEYLHIYFFDFPAPFLSATTFLAASTPPVPRLAASLAIVNASPSCRSNPTPLLSRGYNRIHCLDGTLMGPCFNRRLNGNIALCITIVLCVDGRFNSNGIAHMISIIRQPTVIGYGNICGVVGVLSVSVNVLGVG